jgi:segregation and condensation protein B
MQLQDIILHIEALIFASDKPLTQKDMSEYIGNIFETFVEPATIENALTAIQEKYASEHFPFELKHVGNGYQFLTKKQYHNTIIQLNQDKHIKKLSAAAMETLAIISYKQPITKADIEYIRGVSCDYSIQKLLEKELIKIAGRNENAIGKPLLYATSEHLLNYLGINSPTELPALKEVSNTEIVMPVPAADAQPEEKNQFSDLNVIETPNSLYQ